MLVDPSVSIIYHAFQGLSNVQGEMEKRRGSGGTATKEIFGVLASIVNLYIYIYLPKKG